MGPAGSEGEYAGGRKEQAPDELKREAPGAAEVQSNRLLLAFVLHLPVAGGPDGFWGWRDVQGRGEERRQMGLSYEGHMGPGPCRHPKSSSDKGTPEQEPCQEVQT